MRSGEKPRAHGCGRDAAAIGKNDGTRTEWIEVIGKKRDVGHGSTRRRLRKPVFEEMGSASVESQHADYVRVRVADE